MQNTVLNDCRGQKRALNPWNCRLTTAAFASQITRQPSRHRCRVYRNPPCSGALVAPSADLRHSPFIALCGGILGFLIYHQILETMGLTHSQLITVSGTQLVIRMSQVKGKGDGYK